MDSLCGTQFTQLENIPSTKNTYTENNLKPFLGPT